MFRVLSPCKKAYLHLVYSLIWEHMKPFWGWVLVSITVENKRSPNVVEKEPPVIDAALKCDVWRPRRHSSYPASLAGFPHPETQLFYCIALGTVPQSQRKEEGFGLQDISDVKRYECDLLDRLTAVTWWFAGTLPHGDQRDCQAQHRRRLHPRQRRHRPDNHGRAWNWQHREACRDFSHHWTFLSW